MADIRNPKALRAEDAPKEERTTGKTEDKTNIGTPRVREAKSGRSFLWGGIITAVLVTAVFGGGFFLFSKYEAKKSMLEEAGQKLSESGFGGNLSIPGAPQINSIEDIGKLWPFIKGSFGAYRGLGEAANAALVLSDDATKLQAAISKNLAGTGRGETMAAFRAVKTDLTAMREASDKVDAQSPEIKKFLPISADQYITLKYELRFWEETAANLIDWLSSDRNAVIFLQNSSELRSTGGFWGSFAEVEINNGDIVSSSIRDINELDKTINTKTVPPKPLQLITPNWKTADANWFSNFPDSAARAKTFLDFSGLYSGQGKKIDLIAAVTPAVVSDILAITGPLSASSSKTAIDKDNFLPSIQEEVQSGQKAGSGQAKKILKDIFPVLVSKLLALNSDEQSQLFGDLLDSVKNKDIMLWTEDKNLESRIEEKGAAGSLFVPPQKFNGDYLSVAAANVGGQKSDYVMKQYVSLETLVNLDGTATNHLTVTRQHNGKKGDKWWYTAANQVYLKIFSSDFGLSPSGSGGLAKTIAAPVNYKKLGYDTDAFVSAIEGTAASFKNLANFTGYKESGKSVLATWMKTALGKTSMVSLDYTHRLFLSPADGVVYQFVFDKQPGVNGNYDFSFTAPPGFVWAENNSPVYGYKTTDIIGRFALNLTLKSGSN